MQESIQGSQALRQEVENALSHRMSVLLPGGIELDQLSMGRIALEAGVQVNKIAPAGGKVRGLIFQRLG